MILRPLHCAFFAAALLLSTAGAAFAGNGRFTPIGPDGGEAAVIRVDPWNPSVVYAGAGAGGIFKSSNGGRSWRRLESAVPARTEQRVVDIVLDPTAPTTLYITFGGTVLKSRDAGATFADAGFGIEAFLVYDLEVDPARPAVLYAATDNGLYKTEDGGGSWRAAGPWAGLWITSVAMDPSSPDHVFLGVQDYETGGLYKSTDGGSSWVKKTVGLPAQLPGEVTVRLAADPQVAGRVFATYARYYP